MRTVTATLKVVSEHAYWYLDDKVTVPLKDLEASARTFEERVHPAVVGTFGDIWSPGVDGDPRLIVLHTRLVGAAGYYSSKDEFTRQVHPHSNLSEIIYLDARILPPGTEFYMGVLAHELQHAVHWNQDAGEESWVNEGLSEVAAELAGYPAQFIDGFLRKPETQLNWWPDQIGTAGPNYGASALFFSYLALRYGGSHSHHPHQTPGPTHQGDRGSGVATSHTRHTVCTAGLHGGRLRRVANILADGTLIRKWIGIGREPRGR